MHKSNKKNVQDVPQNCYVDVHLEPRYRYLPRTPWPIHTVPGPSQPQRGPGNQKRRSLVDPARPMAGFPLPQPSFCRECDLSVSRCCADLSPTFRVYEGSDLAFLCLYLVAISPLVE